MIPTTSTNSLKFGLAVFGIAVSQLCAQDAASPAERNNAPGLSGVDLNANISKVSLGRNQDAQEQIAPVEDSGDDSTGTDPRAFTSKLMPYYRFTRLDNDIEVQEAVMFGMLAFSPKFAMTYEIPMGKNMNYEDVDAFSNLASSGFGPISTGGIGPDGLESDGDSTGTGDLNLRFFYKPDNWTWNWKEKGKTHTLMPLIETTFPTASKDILGGEAVIVSPGITWVTDLPGGPPIGIGFFAAMNFLDFDVIRDNDRERTLRYRGRWFWMQPLTKPGKGIIDGLYVLTELQPVYDFERGDFDLWISPEFGKVIRDGLIIYGKPGFGIDKDPEDRDFTFELGMRYFF